MLRTVFARNARMITSARAAGLQMRSYSDKFQERETASENMYIRKKEEEELKALREKLAQVEKQVDDLKKHVDEKEAQAKSK
ncbi:ATPase inhibitor [Coemansia sp. RSA 1290]|nr:hypothetical protein BX667DRAFT_496004 [Coemansia mojavensis]KAJ1744080.1 hypothetical protein LPJ68_000310 [Coemansia sp. RSA 1086]KAJ1752635.1 hypothetical protein LPJ79_001021 [Coemansia sp. RSA 1821]KAJ1874669.1 hypothetical protein LPJ55_001276 [Coemansia sp. RSA 990]KAJ2626208.1 ATPase inhibitor [Coemansia sp. RSA 1290]KAJ2673724.1 hypothetical protein IWW42_002136 [Coemansia sp. RSA 1085]